MNLQSSQSKVETEGEWQVVGAEWWHTPFSSVSWSYIPKRQPFKRRIAQPPHYHASLFLPSSARIANHKLVIPKNRLCVEEEEKLNPDLVGVKVVEQVISRYETDVGFFYTPFPKIEHEELGIRPPLNSCVDQEELMRDREHWRKLVEDLVKYVPDTYLTESEASLESSMSDSVPSSGSEFSLDSFNIPSTPITKASYANILTKNVSPSSSVSSIPEERLSSFAPVKSLNAFASSFVPSLSPPVNLESTHFSSLIDSLESPLASISDFTFPSLNVTSPATVKIKKDEHGFFTDVQVESSSNIDFSVSNNNLHQGSPLLPPFLQEPTRRKGRMSRTREMVERFRSQSQLSSQNEKLSLDFSFEKTGKCVSQSPSPICHDLSFIQPRLSVSEDGGDRVSGFSTPSVEDEDDGWIDVAQPTTTSSASKAKRARDLFLALTRRRTNSVSSEPMKVLMKSVEPPLQAPAVNFAPEAPSPSPPSVTTTDGWIEDVSLSSPPARKIGTYVSPTPTNNKSHGRKKHKNSSSSIATSPTHTSFPSISQTYMPVLSPPHMMSHTPIPFFYSAYPPMPLPIPYAAFMPAPYQIGVQGQVTPIPSIAPISPQFVTPPSVLSPRAPLPKHHPITTPPNLPTRNRT